MYTSHGHHIPGTLEDNPPDKEHPCGGLTECHACIREATLAEKYKTKFDLIEDLIRAGVLGPEQVPDPDYWSWSVRKPHLLPDQFRKSYNEHGEVRWYGE